jgi:hypothetical protein
VFLPCARRLEGKKVLLGDNLASHLSPTVISLCRDNNIEFVCLPANSTDKMQPLDVGFFSVIKQLWRLLLRAYRKMDPAAKLLQKTEFPRMLKELLGKVNAEALLPPAFERCGLYPINPAKVICRIPSIENSEEVARHVDRELLKTLEVRRFGSEKKKVPRGKKLPAGQSYSAQPAEEEEEEAASENEQELEDASEQELEDASEQGQEELGEDCDDFEVEIDGKKRKYSRKQTGKKPLGKNVRKVTNIREKTKKKIPVVVESESESEESEASEWSDGSEESEASEQGEEEQELPDLAPTTSRNSGKLVACVYEGQWFIGEVLKENPGMVPRGYQSISYASIRGQNLFAWPTKKDIMLTLSEDILLRDVTVEPKNSRGQFGLKMNVYKIVETLMVVVYYDFYFLI